MNLIPSNNLKEIILTEYELIKDQIRLRSDHYLDFYYKIELLSITVSLISHSKICIDWIFGIYPDLANLNYEMLGCSTCFVNLSSIHPQFIPPPHVVNTSTHREAAYQSIAYAAPRKRLILGTHKQCNTEYWRRWMTNSKLPLNYM